MTASQIQAEFGISHGDAMFAERYIGRQRQLLALYHPDWWARDHETLKANINSAVRELIVDVWCMARVNRQSQKGTN